MSESLHLRTLHSAEELLACERIQQDVWGTDDLGVTPVHFFVASVHSGGFVLGAFDGDHMVAFLNGFPSYLPDKRTGVGLHSDMMGVLPAYRAKGLGRKLKWFQREWCLARNINWITWTFDPLQAKNARLNLEHLGVTVDEYRVNEYGVLGGGLNGNLPTDRLLAFWDLHAERVQHCRDGIKQAPVDLEKIPKALESVHGKPDHINLDLPDTQLRVAIPQDLNTLLATDFDLALAWRMAVREVLGQYLARGYQIVRFVEGTYIIENRT
ncbi:MAG: GNAT family N-acetyltransferase [Trueperaceae bacterium]|nr:GNAT family N-acetyltransferase [Trueperaceae bacterium]